MEALYLLIPLSVVAVFGAAWVFLRMSDSGQFEDMDGPAWSVLHDDDRPVVDPVDSKADSNKGDVQDSVDSGEKRNAAATHGGDNRNMPDNGDTERIDAAQDRLETISR